MASIKDLQDQMNKNSAAWHGASQAEKDRLHQENIKLQGQIDKMTGGTSTFNPGTGKWTSSGGSYNQPSYNQPSYNKPSGGSYGGSYGGYDPPKYEYDPPKMGGGYVAPGTTQTPQQPTQPQKPAQQIGALYTSNIGGRWMTYDKYGNVYSLDNAGNKNRLTSDMVNSGQLQAIGKVDDYVTDQYRKQSAYAQRRNPNAILGSYLTGVNDNDMEASYTTVGNRYVPTDYGKVIQQAKEDFAEAQRRGDQAGMDRAHQMAEMVRQIHGYSGGADGSQNVPIFVNPGAALPDIGTERGNEAYLWEMRNYLDGGGLYGNGVRNDLGTNTGAYDNNGAAITILDRKRLNEGVNGTMTVNGTTYYRMDQQDANGNPVFMNPATGKMFSGVTDQSGRMSLVQTGQVSPRLDMNAGRSYPAPTAAQGYAAPAAQSMSQLAVQTVPQTTSYQPTSGLPLPTYQQYAGGPRNAYITGKDDYGSTDYSVMIGNAIAAGASADEVERLLNQRLDKAQQNGYTQYMYDDVYQNAMNYINSARQPQQSGDDLYQQYLDQLMQGYDDIMRQQEEANRLAVEQAVGQLSGQKEGIAQSYDDLYRQLYIDRRRAEKNLPQQLAAMGISGGMAEGTALGIQTSYTDALRQGEQEKISAMSDIDRAIYDARLTGDISAAQQAAQLAMNKLASYGDIISAMQQQQNWAKEFAWQQQQQQISNNQWWQQFNRQQALDEISRNDISYDRKLQLAQYLFENTGDASGFIELGFTSEQIAAMQNSYAAAMQAQTQNKNYTPKKQEDDDPKYDGGDDDDVPVPDFGLQSLQTQLTQMQDRLNPSRVPQAAANLIKGFLERGSITEDTARRLLAQYGYSV